MSDILCDEAVDRIVRSTVCSIIPRGKGFWASVSVWTAGPPGNIGFTCEDEMRNLTSTNPVGNKFSNLCNMQGEHRTIPRQSCEVSRPLKIEQNEQDRVNLLVRESVGT